jgi:hypothetical protein
MIYKINKYLLLEEASFLDHLSSGLKKLYNKFFNKFKTLSQSEFNELLNLLYGWYYLNYKLDDTFESKNKELVKIIQKIKTESNLKIPRKLYRGLSFDTGKDRKEFLDECEKTGYINGKIFRLKKSTHFTAWTSSKKIAETFLSDGENSSSDNGFSILIELDTLKLQNDNIFFSIEYLLRTEEERKEFLKLVLEQEHKENQKLVANAKKVGKLDPNQMFGYQHGAMFSLMEKEFILKLAPTSLCKFINITKKS